MSEQPTVFDQGHGPFSSVDEIGGGAAGALILGELAYDRAGPVAGVAGVAVGWAVGEALHDPAKDAIDAAE